MLYYVLKTIHIISAAFFIGSFTITIAGIFLRHEKTGKLLIPLSLITLMIQPITGFSIIAVKHYNPMSLWVIGTLICFTTIGCLWLVTLYLQQCNLDRPTDKRWQQVLLFTTLAVLFLLYYLMTERPT